MLLKCSITSWCVLVFAKYKCYRIDNRLVLTYVTVHFNLLEYKYRIRCSSQLINIQSKWIFSSFTIKEVCMPKKIHVLFDRGILYFAWVLGLWDDSYMQVRSFISLRYRVCMSHTSSQYCVSIWTDFVSPSIWYFEGLGHPKFLIIFFDLHHTTLLSHYFK